MILEAITEDLRYLKIELPAKSFRLTVVRKQFSIPEHGFLPLVVDFGVSEEALVLSVKPRWLTEEQRIQLRDLVRYSYGPVKVGEYGWYKPQQLTTSRFKFENTWFIGFRKSNCIIEDKIVEVRWGDWLVTEKGYMVRLLGVEAPKPMGMELDAMVDEHRWLARGYDKDMVEEMAYTVRDYVRDKVEGKDVVIYLPIEGYRNVGYLYGWVLYKDDDGILKDLGTELLREFDIVSVWVPYREEMDVYNEEVLRNVGSGMV